MKEETPNYQQQQESGVMFGGEGRCIEAKDGSSAPSARFKHQSFMYKGRFYVHGGTTIPSSDFADDPLDIYCYHLDGQKAGSWQRIRTRVVGAKEVESVSAHAAAVGGNKWFVFGGSNSECKPNAHLLRLNLDSYEWTRLEQRGEVPSARESAFLTFLEKNWLVLYGGMSTTEVDIYNTFHFYNLDTRNWSTCDGSYQYQVYARLDPALTLFRDRLYLFGGTYRTMNNEEKYLNDFYEISIAPPARNQAGRVQMKRLSSKHAPEGRSGHSLVGLGEHHLLLMGGENTNSQLREGMRIEDVSLVDDMWLFDTRCGEWSRLELSVRGFRFRSMTCCLNHNDRLYFFGGVHNYSNVLRDLVEITADPLSLTTTAPQPLPCLKCHEFQHFSPPRNYFPTSIIDDMVANIDFPFAAFGLLIDNAMNSDAALLKISYFHALGQQKQRLLKFEDDAKLNWTDEELLDSVGNFNAGQMYMPAGIDKKVKMGIQRDNLRREYGYNLKLGSLRLGESFLFISYNGDDSLFRVFSFERQGDRYLLHFYSYNIFERKVSAPHMEATRQHIAAKHGDLIQAVFFTRKCRNTLFIFSPRIQEAREAADEEETELKADLDNSNILNGPILKIRELQKSGFFIQECVDVSLRAYITCLYLKNEKMKIMLSVKEAVSHPVEVQTQAFLEKVDRLCKHKHVLEINPAFEFDLKITEIYYLYDLKRKLSFFNNGLLIYHKNRLITRFKYPLGELLLRKYYKHADCHNFLRIFGFLELPDHIPVNLFKTSYLHHIMMERLFSRLKFISKAFKQEFSKMVKDPDYRRAAPTRLNEEEAQQDRSEISEPKPPRQRNRKPEPAQREISLRRRKHPRESLEERLKHLVKDPTSDKIKEFMRFIANTSNKQENPADPTLTNQPSLTQQHPSEIQQPRENGIEHKEEKEMHQEEKNGVSQQQGDGMEVEQNHQEQIPALPQQPEVQQEALQQQSPKEMIDQAEQQQVEQHLALEQPHQGIHQVQEHPQQQPTINHPPEN